MALTGPLRCGLALDGRWVWALGGSSLTGSVSQPCHNGLRDEPDQTQRSPWDFDGTLVDTEEVWVQTEIEVMARYGVAWSYEQGVALCGASGPATMRAMWAEATSQLGEPLEQR